MVVLKKKEVSITLILILLLGGCSPSNRIMHDNQSIFEKNTFNTFNKKIEIEVDNKNIDLEVLGLDISKNNIYLKIDDVSESKYIIKDMLSGNSQILYENRDVFATASSGVYKDKVYIVETEDEDYTFVSYIVMIGSDGDHVRYRVSDMNKIPYVQQVGNLLILNYEQKEDNIVESHLDYFNMDNNNSGRISNHKYIVHSTGNITGEFILFCGGMDDVIYYQVVEYINQNIEKDGKSYIYKTNKNNLGIVEKVMALNNKLIFISGDNNSLVGSDYIYEAPFYDSGQLFVNHNNEWKRTIIPNVTAGNDIIGAKKIGNSTLLIYTPKDFYLYDYQNMKYMQRSYGTDDGIYGDIMASENTFYYLEKTSSKYFLYLHKYIEKEDEK